MKFVIFLVFTVIAVEGWIHNYGNECVTYSIGEKFQEGDILIKNETIESKLITFRRQMLHRLEYKILNDDNLLSFAQIDIIDTDQPHEVHIFTHPTCYEIQILSKCKITGSVKIYHKNPDNFVHLSDLFPSLFSGDYNWPHGLHGDKARPTSSANSVASDQNLLKESLFPSILGTN